MTAGMRRSEAKGRQEPRLGIGPVCAWLALPTGKGMCRLAGGAQLPPLAAGTATALSSVLLYAAGASHCGRMVPSPVWSATAVRIRALTTALSPTASGYTCRQSKKKERKADVYSVVLSCGAATEGLRACAVFSCLRQETRRAGDAPSEAQVALQRHAAAVREKQQQEQPAVC